MIADFFVGINLPKQHVLRNSGEQSGEHFFKEIAIVLNS